MDAPALPWAVAPAPAPAPAAADSAERPAEEEEEHIDVENLQPLGLDDVELTAGSWIEVKWNVSTEADEGDLTSLWWRCRVGRPEKADVTGAEDGTLFLLDYDALDGHEAETRQVRFTGKHDLLDVEEGGLMAWRRQGDLWDEDDEEDGEVYSAQEILDSLGGTDAAAEAVGNSHAQMVSEALSGLPMDVQMQVAERVRTFTDGIVNSMKRKLGASNGPTTITMTDVQEMVEDLKRAKH